MPAYIDKAGQRFLLIVDQLGSPTLVVNAETGEVAQRLEYDESLYAANAAKRLGGESRLVCLCAYSKKLEAKEPATALPFTPLEQGYRACGSSRSGIRRSL